MQLAFEYLHKLQSNLHLISCYDTRIATKTLRGLAEILPTGSEIYTPARNSTDWYRILPTGTEFYRLLPFYSDKKRLISSDTLLRFYLRTAVFCLGTSSPLAPTPTPRSRPPTPSSRPTSAPTRPGPRRPRPAPPPAAGRLLETTELIRQVPYFER